MERWLVCVVCVVELAGVIGFASLEVVVFGLAACDGLGVVPVLFVDF